MDQHLPQLYKDYGDYSNYRNFPLDIDGLKPVERRVLLSAYKIARQKLVKSRQVDAYTIGHYHPHGEVYGTIVQMVRQGFLIGQGNFGANIGTEPVGPAAPRYTECKMNPLTVDLALKYVDNVSWVDTELDDKEPEYLPTMFPLCLIGTEYTQGIGFGYKTFIPCYNIRDLYQRLLWLLGERKRKPIISPISDCKILSPPDVLESLLTTGKAKIDVEGVIEINQRRNEVHLRSWPPGKRFISLLAKFSKELSENMIGFTDLSKDSTDIVFQVLRERNRDRIFQEFVDKLKIAISGSISFECIVVDSNKNVLVKSIDKMLVDTFNMFSNVNKNMLKHEIDLLNDSIAEYNILDIIKNDLVSCIGNGFDVASTADYIKNKTGIEPDITKHILGKYRISKLLTLNTDTNELVSQKQNLENNLQNINAFILSQYNTYIK